MKLRDLKKVKNKILCELEDHLLDAIIENMEGIQNESSDSLVKVAKKVSLAVKDNALSIALICYENDDGSDLTEDDVIGIPLKIKVFSECFNPIMELVMGYMNGERDEETQDTGKPRRVVSKRNS